MILIKCDRHGAVTKLADSDKYNYLVAMLSELTEELEAQGIFLINEIATKNLSRTLEFASTEHGWECAIMLVHGYVKSINNRDAED